MRRRRLPPRRRSRTLSPHTITQTANAALDFTGRCSCGATVWIQFVILDLEWSILHSVPGGGQYHEIRTDTEPVEGLILDLDAAMVNRMPTKAELDASHARFVGLLDQAFNEALPVFSNVENGI